MSGLKQAWMGLGLPPQLFPRGLADTLGHGQIHPFFAAEMVGNGGLVHPGQGCQLAGGHPVVAVAAKEGFPRIQEPFPGLVRRPGQRKGKGHEVGGDENGHPLLA